MLVAPARASAAVATHRAAATRVQPTPISLCSRHPWRSGARGSWHRHCNDPRHAPRDPRRHHPRALASGPGAELGAAHLRSRAHPSDPHRARRRLARARRARSHGAAAGLGPPVCVDLGLRPTRAIDRGRHPARRAARAAVGHDRGLPRPPGVGERQCGPLVRSRGQRARPAAGGGPRVHPAGGPRVSQRAGHRAAWLASRRRRSSASASTRAPATRPRAVLEFPPSPLDGSSSHARVARALDGDVRRSESALGPTGVARPLRLSGAPLTDVPPVFFTPGGAPISSAA